MISAWLTVEIFTWANTVVNLVQSHLTHDILTLRGIRDLSGLNLKVISRTALEVEGGIGTSARTREHDHRLAILLLDHHILVIDRPVVRGIMIVPNLSGRAVSVSW